MPEPAALLALLRASGRPMNASELAQAAGIRSPRHVVGVDKRLLKMVADGVVLRNRHGDFFLTEKLDVIAGVVSAHRDGYGFLAPDDGSPDVHVSAAEMRAVLDGDRVAVRLDQPDRRGRRSGHIVEILSRGRVQIVGRYRRENGIGFVVESGRVPHHYLIPERFRGGAEPEQLVQVEIIEYPSADREARGRIIRLFGESSEPGALTDSAIAMFSLPSSWSHAVLAAAGKLGDAVTAADCEGRTDLRQLPLVTIDGEDARDFDDAVFAEPSGDGWRLIVAIADVSHYVRAGDAIDNEAQRRGTSVYFADRVVPMLPEALSNELCSLKPRVDRLCVACEMQVDRSGRVRRSRFYRAVMHSRARLTYTEVDRTRTDPEGASGALRRLLPHIDHLYGVFRSLLRERRRRGALDLDLPEVKIEIGADGLVEAIRPRFRNDAHRLIEECMIAANVAAATHLRRAHLPTLFRVHDGPPEEKFEELRLLFQALGIPIPEVARRRAGDINVALQKIRARPDFPALATSVLRSMSQAVYQSANIGHFGLGLGCYSHFTSPIRRYPDLIVHRGIVATLGRGKGFYPYDVAAVDQLGRSTSMQERRADEAARYVESRFKCLFMREHIGAVKAGLISGITPFGLFVTLRDIYVDGLVHVSNLGRDYYRVVDGGRRLEGERSRQSFALGDEISVRVVRVDPDDAKIDLVPVDSAGNSVPARRAVPHVGQGARSPAKSRQHGSKAGR